MSKTDLTEVLRRLPSLSDGELTEVRKRTTALLSSSGGAQPGTVTTQTVVAEPKEDWLLAGIYWELRARGIMRQDERVHALPPNYADNSKRVWSHLATKVRRPMTAVERSGLGRLAAEALAGWLTKAGVPLTPRTMLGNVTNVPRAIEAAFPGYMGAGLLAFIWQPHG